MIDWPKYDGQQSRILPRTNASNQLVDVPWNLALLIWCVWCLLRLTNLHRATNTRLCIWNKDSIKCILVHVVCLH